jgi:hypothetical protein
MANMSHCRFENTFNDLKDCYEALANKPFNELSERELKYATKLITLCKDINADFGEEDYDDDEDV